MPRHCKPGDALLDELFVVGVAAAIGFESLDARAVLARFLLDQRGGVLPLVIIEDYVGAGLSEHLHRSGADTARAAGDQRRLAGERNHSVL